MPDLQGTETHRNLELGFARESQAAMRYRYFAQQADIEGEPEIAALFRSLADGATGHALGHLELLAEIADPATGMPIEVVADSVASASTSEAADHNSLYPAFGATARSEGFTEVGEWMNALAKADHVDRLANGAG
jgi:rubrerythrin